ncbi:MAG: diaminopimelate decarboxylase [Proteobacteria bacterium]|nr:diaminopimelate decarboxylase [Pseudomonadota bacterium]
MSPVCYRGGELCAEEVPLARVAESVETPLYCYSSAAMAESYRRLAAALGGLPATLCYALKANSNLAVIRTFARLGAGADVVSEGELRRALAAGVAPAKIVLSGVGKGAREMALALEAGILQVNVESEPELEALAALARGRGRRAPVALRVNPDVDPQTHAKITTGRRENKFGVALEAAEAVLVRAASLPGIEVQGVAVHIGSQLVSLDPFRRAFARIAGLVRRLRAAGLAIRRLDLGGGLGIRYRDEQPPTPEAYAALVAETVGGLGCELIFEPGRLLVGNAGVLLTRVLYVKRTASHRFVIVDAGMNDLIRPALYDAWHEIVPVREPAPGAGLAPAEVVGPVCETGDTFARARALPEVAAGDLLAIRSAGAYGAVMASAYNSRPLVPEVLVRGADFAVVRPRPALAAMLAEDRLPPWLVES